MMTAIDTGRYAMLADEGIRRFMIESDALLPPDAVNFTMAEQRAFYDKLCAHFRRPRPAGLDVRDLAVEGPAGPVPIRLYRPTVRGPLPVLLYLHGGGYVLGLPQLLANRAQMQEVFVNLIMNAIEAMHSITDRAHLLRITSDISQGCSTVLVTIEDTGTGIDSKDKDRIFEPFFTTKSKGTGIGLAICRAVVETHSGSLHASANDPCGTIFHVALPSGNLL